MSSELIVKQRARFLVIDEYGGVCHSCGSPVSYNGPIQTLVLEDNITPNEIRLFVLDKVFCPFCDCQMVTIKVYKNMEVTEEFAGVK